MELLSRLTLTTRLTLLTVVTLVPLLVLVILSDINETESRREAGYAEARAYTQNIATSLESVAGGIDSYMTAAALVIGAEPGPITHASTGPYLTNLLTRYPNFRALFITDLDGKVIASSGADSTGVDLSTRPYISALKAGKKTVWTAQAGLESGEIIAAYARPIKNPGGTAIAYAVVAFQAANIVQSLPPEFPKDANLIIVDEKGQLIVSVFELGLKVGEKNIGGSPHVAPALAGEFVEFHSTETEFDGDERYGAVAAVPSMGWAIGYTRSQALLDTSVRNDFWRDIAIAVAIVSASYIVVLLMVRAVTRPLRRLSVGAALMAVGHETTLPTPGRFTDPDVAGLGRDFSAMVEQVREREARLVEQTRTLTTLEQMGALIASGLEFEKTLQSVIDAGTRVTEASFGAFFYKVGKDRGQEPYELYTVSGVGRETFTGLPMPGDTEVFGPTYRGESPVRSEDITKDPRYGKHPPYFGLPKGHMPVRSYLAVPVISATGETIGGLFFGHEETGIFQERHERLATGIASWASIALDNARVYSDAQAVQQELRKSNESKDEFLGLISHELRTPVTTIYGGLRLLQARYAQFSDEDRLELLSSMADEGSRMVRLIENLLAFARLELGRPIDAQPVAITPLVRHVIEAFERQSPARHVETTLAEGLSPVVLEPTYFEQIMHNLLSNADKYSPAGEGIEVKVTETDIEVRVTVSDHGPGVAKDEVDAIFEGFYRSDRTSSQAAGHGLGLTVCKRLVETQGGRIWAKNRDGGGLEVGFAFPTIPVEELVT